ncbi:conserved Plasmodium protein, unknown function [Plasmodium relictum]|uniref:Uncharacterized protein n=1 Tax=Plasmodium relictum TaxID=85471 RepID=A0A1J1HC46_PLARL|nr:conserved Plasmodium protein, unknown function [Plasmodium relictum]CRH02528.1 conserved Plasmodium protein, unknown function [Plasmodium relictum]
MNKKQFFHIVENDVSLSNDNYSLDLSYNSSIDNENEVKKKNNISDDTEYANFSDDTFNNFTKRNALNFLGLNKKKLENSKFNKVNESTNNAHMKNVMNKIDDINKKPSYEKIKCINENNCDLSHVGNNILVSDSMHINRNINEGNALFKEDTHRKKQHNKEFYCLKHIIHNNLNNNYDKNDVKIFNIYHNNRAECLFNDVSIIKFVGCKNICIYENKNYIYKEINNNLFQHKNITETPTFNPDNDIYEYIYNNKMKLNNDNNNNNNEDDDIQCFQFYIHNYPSFLKEKIKIFIHIYNMFSIYPYINHKFIEEEIYSENLKVFYSSEKILNIKWQFFEKKELKNILNDIISYKKENYLQENFVKINDFIYINFLTQEIKMHDIKSTKFNNYIILNGNGLCFSAYYYLIVPYHRYINENEVDKNNSYNLSYEYIFLSQLFNIYDNFNICFLYPLFIAYFFYYHLFVKKKIKLVSSFSYHNISVEENINPEHKKDVQYNNNNEESYIDHLNDIYVKLKKCFKKIIINSKNQNIKITNNIIEFLLPESCYKIFENVEFLCKNTHHLSLLYAVCINKHDFDSKELINKSFDVEYKNLNNNFKNDKNYNTTFKYFTKDFNIITNGITQKEKEEYYERSLCFNEIKEINNLRNIFPDDKKYYFNTCNKIDNIIKVSIRNDGICFFYMKNITEYLFFSFFIIFNSLENLFLLMNKRKVEDKTEYFERGEKYIFPVLNDNSFMNLSNNFKREEIKNINSYTLNDNFYYSNNDNILNIFNDTIKNYSNNHNLKNNSSEASTFVNINRIFEMNNIKNIYNDIYICENKKVNTFKLINIMNKEKKKILIPYYFNKSEITHLFFLRLSNIHIYDINTQLNKVFEYINYNNKTFTPFLKNLENYDMNVQLDLLENIYTINDEVYLLYVKKINYSDDIYKYNYLYVQNYLLKNYILYYNIYFNISDELKKNEYYKLKYTNKNKEIISIHFTLCFNYVYDKIKFHFQLKPIYYITHIEKNKDEYFEEKNYISFISQYVNSKCVK